MQGAVQKYAADNIPENGVDNFYPIYGHQAHSDKTESDYAFLAVMICGPQENSEEFKAQQEAALLDSVKPAPELSTSLNEGQPDPYSAELPAPVDSNVAPKRSTVALEDALMQRKLFITERLKQNSGSVALVALESINNIKIVDFISKPEMESLSDKKVIDAYSDFLLERFAQVGKFRKEEYLMPVSDLGGSPILKDKITASEVEELFKDRTKYKERSVAVIVERKAILDMFGEALVLKHMTNPSLPPRNLTATDLPEKSNNVNGANGNNGEEASVVPIGSPVVTEETQTVH